MSSEHASTARIIECPCGVVIDGADDNDVVTQARSHAKSVHDMDLSETQALDMAQPA